MYIILVNTEFDALFNTKIYITEHTAFWHIVFVHLVKGIYVKRHIYALGFTLLFFQLIGIYQHQLHIYNDTHTYVCMHTNTCMYI